MVVDQKRGARRHPLLYARRFRKSFQETRYTSVFQLMLSPSNHLCTLCRSFAAERRASWFFSIASVYPEPRRALFVCSPGMVSRAFLQISMLIFFNFLSRNSF